LIDITLAGEMDGIATAEIIRAELEIPVIYMTALSDDKTLARAKITTPYAYLVKPFQERELQIAVQIALYNHHLESSLKHRTQELEALQRVSTAIRSTFTLEEIFPVILEQLRSAFNVSSSAIALLVPPEQSELSIAISSGEWTHWQGQRLPAQEGIYAEIIAANQPVTGIVLPISETSAASFTTGVPMIAFQKVIGILFINCANPLPTDLLHLLVAISDIAANAIHRQALHQQLEEQYRAYKIAQQQLAQSEKLAALGKMITGIAHEVNNPLAAILLYAQILQQQNANESMASSLDKIVQEAQRAAQIVRGLLDFARQRPANRMPTQVNQTVKLSLDLAQCAPLVDSIRFETHLADDLPITLADPLQLQQVFLNLINNACQAMAATARKSDVEQSTMPEHVLRIITQYGPPLYVLDRTASQPVIRVVFQDNGAGISPDIMPRIFDPFFTTYPGRVGLGLSICHGILSEHGGRIWAESQIGQGATFFVELPAIT
jgi:signal transduction histidine kinase